MWFDGCHYGIGYEEDLKPSQNGWTLYPINGKGPAEVCPSPIRLARGGLSLSHPTSRYELHVSDDGNTAMVRHVWSGGINVGVELKPDLDTIGIVDVIEEITLDLTNDNPWITNVRLGQKISA